MSDDVDKPENSDSEPQGACCGERLAEARREQQIAVIEIAKELHLDENKVRSLERNEFEVLGAPVFAKGYLKKYAQLVNVNADDVLADYYRMNRAAEMPPVVSERPRPRQELSPGPWIAIVVVIMLAIAAYLWFTRPGAPGPGLPDRVSAEPSAASATSPDDEAVVPADVVGTSPQAATDERAATAAPESSEPESSEPESSEPAAVEPEPVEPEVRSVQRPAAAPVEETSSPGIAEGQVRVLLTYTGDCWTEVTDATGRRLFFALGRDGRSVELSGAEPLNVLFGNPGNVEVVVNGDDFALPETARPDRPMRLTLSGN